MKKLILIALSITLFTACDNEPIDSDLLNQDQGGGGDDDGGTDSSDLTLSLYELDTKVNVSFFGFPLETITNSDLNISENKINSSTTAASANNSPFMTENQIITRNSSGQITSDISVNSEGVTTNEYIISYTNGNISQITYDYFEDDEDDYIYNFTYNGNTINRTEVGSNISTVFILDGSNRVIKKESFDGEFSIQVENVTYSASGNITSSTTTGETESIVTYEFDTNVNPLKIVFGDNYILGFLTDDYSDEIGPIIAQFHSTNNWNGATFNGDAFDFNLQYNAVGRITQREMIYNYGEDLSFEVRERFTYVN
uniref:hypothetical protein n=1 Tax=Gelidibacter sp. TaxID=2018083 RepID=UPI004048EDE1